MLLYRTFIKPFNRKSSISKIVVALCLLVTFSCTSCQQMPYVGGAVSKPMDPAQFVVQTVFFFLAMLGVYWMLVLKPQQDEQKNRETFLENLKKQDDVITKGGIIAKVVNVKPDEITLEISPNIKIKVLPSHVYPMAKDVNVQSKE